MRLGAKRPLHVEDMWYLPRGDKTKLLTDTLEAAWARQQAKPNGTFFKAYLSAFGVAWFITSAGFLAESLLLVVEPFLLGRILTNLQNNGPRDEAYYYGAGLVVSIASHIILHHIFYLRSWRMGYQLLSATSGVLFRKSLRISKQSFATVTTGHVINLVSNDVERFVQASGMVHFLYLGPIQVSRVGKEAVEAVERRSESSCSCGCRYPSLSARICLSCLCLSGTPSPC